jgi:hypothetical protein
LTGETYAQSEPDIVKYREIIADNLSKAGWSWGWVSAVDSNGRTILIADAYCGDGKCFVVSALGKTDHVFLNLKGSVEERKVFTRRKTALHVEFYA